MYVVCASKRPCRTLRITSSGHTVLIPQLCRVATVWGAFLCSICCRACARRSCAEVHGVLVQATTARSRNQCKLRRQEAYRCFYAFTTSVHMALDAAHYHILLHAAGASARPLRRPTGAHHQKPPDWDAPDCMRFIHSRRERFLGRVDEWAWREASDHSYSKQHRCLLRSSTRAPLIAAYLQHTLACARS